MFLAFCIPEPRKFCKTLDLSPHTKNTHTTVEAVLKGIEETRKQGYAMDEVEYVPGVRCIAAPVLNSYGNALQPSA